MNFKVNISQSDSNMAGEIFSLTCSATLMDSPPSSIVPFATFEWFFGPNGNASLPSAVTPMPTNLNTNNTYTSTLQFSSLSQSLHTGIYTCRLGAGNLVNSTMVTVKGIICINTASVSSIQFWLHMLQLHPSLSL